MTKECKPAWIPCVHEAAHAVIAHLQNGQIIKLWVSRCGEWNGECFAEFDGGNVEGLILFLMAGYWAQHHIGQCHFPMHYCSVDQSLWKQAAKDHQISDEQEAALWKKAEELVLQHRRLIRHAAKRLRKGKPGHEVIRFITSRPYLEASN